MAECACAAHISRTASLLAASHCSRTVCRTVCMQILYQPQHVPAHNIQIRMVVSAGCHHSFGPKRVIFSSIATTTCLQDVRSSLISFDGRGLLSDCFVPLFVHCSPYFQIDIENIISRLLEGKCVGSFTCARSLSQSLVAPRLPGTLGVAHSLCAGCSSICSRVFHLACDV